ncbi:MAG TPA: hypothetical protein VHT04_12955 [Stellaceae bacterium]|nr:hypothetical protein [Stellaceae bacterium]
MRRQFRQPQLGEALRYLGSDPLLRAGVERGTREKEVSILAANRGLLVETATTLLAKETMSSDDLRAVAARLLPPSDGTKPAKLGLALAAATRQT